MYDENEIQSEENGYSIVVKYYDLRPKQIGYRYLVGVKMDGIDESMRNSSIRLYANDDDVKQAILQRIQRLKRLMQTI